MLQQTDSRGAPPPILGKTFLRWGLLCLLAGLAFGLAGSGVRADQHLFEKDYILCPAHLRVQGPQELRAARGSKASELRVSWEIPPLTSDIGSPLDGAFVTVIVSDGISTVVQNLPPSATAVTLHPVPRGRDLEVAIAFTRQRHVISSNQRVRLWSTQIRTWERERSTRTEDRNQAQTTTTQTSTTTTTPLTKLATITGLNAESPNANPDTGMKLTWTRPTDTANIAKFKVQYCTDAACGAPADGGEPAKSATSTTVTGLTRNTDYWFRIRALAANADYHSEWSNTATGKTAKTQLPAVTGWTAGPPDANPDTGMKLTWNAPTDTTNIANFVIQYCTDAACGTPVDGGSPASSATEHAVTGLTRNTAYHFRIRAVANTADYESSQWSTTTATTAKTQLPTVTGVSTNSVTSNSMNLGWTAPSDTTIISDFYYQICSNSDCSTVIQSFTTARTGTGASFSPLASGTTYYFRIRARAFANSDYLDSDWSAIASGATLSGN